MKKWIKIIAWVLVTVIATFLLFGLWYQRTYSMALATAYEVNDPTGPQHILIATQGSEFKNAVVQEVVREFKSRQMYIKVIDIAGLADIKEDEWSAIIILHTWEYSRPPKAVKNFIDRVQKNNAVKNRLVVLTTSGGGHYKMQDIDAISSASKLSEASQKAIDIITRVNRILSTSKEL